MTGARLAARGLRVEFRERRRGDVRIAVRGVDVDVAPGESLGVLGASGAGKSTLARALTLLVEPQRGTIAYDGEVVWDGGRTDRRRMRRLLRRHFRRRVQIVFQDPGRSLNPRHTVGDLVIEGAVIHRLVSRRERLARTTALLRQVGLDPLLASRSVRRLSGGQRQRVAIARALAVEPSVLVLDEPTSALDVVARGEILELVGRLRQERSLSCLVISHDVDVVARISDRVVVMDAGRIVEEGAPAELFATSTHPTTRRLLRRR